MRASPTPPSPILAASTSIPFKGAQFLQDPTRNKQAVLAALHEAQTHLDAIPPHVQPFFAAEADLVRYQEAVVYVVLHQQRKAVALLRPLFAHRVPRTSPAALCRHITALYFDVLVALEDVSEADRVATHLETDAARAVFCAGTHLSLSPDEFACYRYLCRARVGLIQRPVDHEALAHTWTEARRHKATSPFGLQCHAALTHLEARAHTLRGRPAAALNLLHTALEATRDPRARATLLNNAACIYYAMERFHLANTMVAQVLEQHYGDASLRNGSASLVACGAPHEGVALLESGLTFRADASFGVCRSLVRAALADLAVAETKAEDASQAVLWLEQAVVLARAENSREGGLYLITAQVALAYAHLLSHQWRDAAAVAKEALLRRDLSAKDRNFLQCYLIEATARLGESLEDAKEEEEEADGAVWMNRAAHAVRRGAPGTTIKGYLCRARGQVSDDAWRSGAARYLASTHASVEEARVVMFASTRASTEVVADHFGET